MLPVAGAAVRMASNVQDGGCIGVLEGPTKAMPFEPAPDMQFLLGGKFLPDSKLQIHAPDRGSRSPRHTLPKGRDILHDTGRGRS